MKRKEKALAKGADLMKNYSTVFNMPKIELHAHLNGCIRPKTFMELATQQGVDVTKVLEADGKTTKVAFETFGLIHKLCNSLPIVQRITYEMIEDFNNLSTVYLEIRSTPKKFGDSTLFDYLEGILQVLQETAKIFPIITRLLISINRSESVDYAKETLEAVKVLLQNEEYAKYIVGVDFSGNPNANTFSAYVPTLEEFRALGLKITVHIAEIMKEVEDGEVEAILQFKPERLGHCCCCTSDQFEYIIENNIPIEICPTSNINTMKVNSAYELQHINTIIQMKIPFAICTDDTFLFGSNLMNEMFEIMTNFHLDLIQIKQIQINTVDFIFDHNVKEIIKNKIESFPC